MEVPSTHQQVRFQLVKHLKKDTIGPSFLGNTLSENKSEILELEGSTPIRYFLTGFLVPKSSGKQIPNPDSGEPETGGENLENITLKTGFLRTSSIGCTVRPSENSKEITINLEWGRYSKIGGNKWQRSNHKVAHLLNLVDFDFGKKETIAVADNVELYIRRGKKTNDTLSVRIVNTYSGDNKSNAEETLYQPEIRIVSDTTFEEVRRFEEIRNDQTMEILYNESTILALGHNVGVDWINNQEVFTTFLPQYEIPTMEPDERLNQFIPNIEDLGSEDSAVFESAMLNFEKFTHEYRQWIEIQSQSLERKFGNGLLKESLKDKALSLIEKAYKNVTRIEDGIRFLSENENARYAFKLANQAIKYSQDEPTHPDITSRSGKFQWRPFQIAFILLNIKGLCSMDEEEEGFEERSIIDLAWFPTGGGKTEAYLGLIAIVSFFRRITYPEKEKSPQVHTIMRYTLRLLTSDQADRIIRLLGAMNYIFEGEFGRGLYPRFRLGMWVGSDVSPNDLLKNPNRPYGTVSAEESLQRIKNFQRETKGSVIQFEVCPWCGDDSEDGIKNPKQWNIGNLNGKKCLMGVCSDSNCIFGDDQHGIPFTPIDDDIYLNPPTVLLATVDKIARLAKNPWAKSIDKQEDSEVAKKYNVRSLFGFDGINRPPDLVIQDELHLLSGPLGTTSGLIESVIDVLWKNVNHYPKYVAATATIKGAERDSILMYGRELNIFPPPVAKASDNFFAKENNEKPGRLHVAILGPPDRARTLLNQPAASLLQRIHDLRLDPNVDKEIIDPYYTLVSYFNSLRELGGAQASIPGRIATELMPRFSEDADSVTRVLHEMKELTSRKSIHQLKEVKASLKRPCSENHSVDTVVTTNMFQVGIDIPRLGLMTIVGQPKSNSEYIQSSGRIGRRYPGLVVSLLRSTFPRDQSHYENFREFHQEIYRSVDNTSTTPFSQRSLDRGSPTALAILLRMGMPELSQRKSLKNFQSGNVREKAEKLRDSFTECISVREGHSDVETHNELIRESKTTFEAYYSRLSSFVTKCLIDNCAPCWEIYNKDEQTQQKRRGFLPSSSMTGDRDITVMNSLRDVADEVRVGDSFEISKGFSGKLETIPEGHLFSQSAVGSIWEKDGSNFLTMGINLWDNGPENRDLATKESGGLWYNDDALSQLLPANTKLRFLPKNKTHGKVAISRFPYKNGMRCKAGHLFDAETPVDGKTICPRCDEDASPTRFVSICSDGHLHPFDYFSWVHNSKHSCQRSANLKLIKKKGASYTLDAWVVECEDCGKQRSLGRLPHVTEKTGPKCSGWRPWLGHDSGEECDKRLTHISIGSVSLSYPEGGSILLIPLTISWSLAEGTNLKSLINILKVDENLFDNMIQSSGFSDAVKLELNDTDYVKNNELDIHKLKLDCKEYINIQNEPLKISNIRSRELLGMCNINDTHNYDNKRFNARYVVKNAYSEQETKWKSLEWPIKSIVRVDRLTELRYVTGLTRGGDNIDGQEKLIQPIDMRDGDKFGYCRLHFGEGILFNIKPEYICNIAKTRNDNLSPEQATMIHTKDHIVKNYREQMPYLENNDKNLNEFSVLHTLSHLLIKELCEVSGFSLGSIRERLYMIHNENNEINQCSILLYTSGPSSDGTLGGLVRQATKIQIGKIVDRAIAAQDMCSNDPVCHDHHPNSDEPNGAACHSCVYLPETSCELRNYLLDRRWG